MGGVFPEGFDGLLFLFGGVVSEPLLFLEVLSDFLGFLVDFCAVFSYSILTELITDSFGNCNVLGEGNFGRTYSKLGPFCSSDCSPLLRGLLDRLMTHFLLMMSGAGVFLYFGCFCRWLNFLIWWFLVILSTFSLDLQMMLLMSMKSLLLHLLLMLVLI